VYSPMQRKIEVYFTYLDHLRSLCEEKGIRFETVAGVRAFVARLFSARISAISAAIIDHRSVPPPLCVRSQPAGTLTARAAFKLKQWSLMTETSRNCSADHLPP
jgi:hypothetical protein